MQGQQHRRSQGPHQRGVRGDSQAQEDGQDHHGREPAVEKHYWQNFYLAKELDEAVLKNLIYGTHPFLQLPEPHRRQEPPSRGQPQVREAPGEDRGREGVAGEARMVQRQRRGPHRRPQDQLRGERRRRPPLQEAEAPDRAVRPVQVLQHPQGHDASAGADVVQLAAEGLLDTDPSRREDVLQRDAERHPGTRQEEEQYRQDLL